MDIELYKKELKQRGWTYRDLAQKTGISLTNISRIMAGIVTDPRYSTIQAIEQALNLNVFFTPAERAAGLSETRKMNVTPIEEDCIYVFRQIGKRYGEQAQRDYITIGENMLNLK